MTTPTGRAKPGEPNIQNIPVRTEIGRQIKEAFVGGCVTCGSKGFERSVLGPHRCTFCDGTVGGSLPTEQDVEESASLINAALRVYKK